MNNKQLPALVFKACGEQKNQFVCHGFSIVERGYTIESGQVIAQLFIQAESADISNILISYHATEIKSHQQGTDQLTSIRQWLDNILIDYDR